ncbi:hypothetical protein HDV06_006741 [Boothiomyces sp. JEL0866]|nr:hypothetical protein HDV06_006741 [Boothiomyces sp. JEL0866]
MFLLITRVLALNPLLQFQDAKSDLLEFGTNVGRFTKELLVKTNSLTGDTAWTQFTHSSYPGYGLRVQTNGKLCDPTVRQYSGYLDTADDKHYYFWFFESRDKPSEDPVIMWLNGGPGCSSFIGLLTELGPCNINKDGSGTDFNNFSWNSNANIFFLDQPVNVGLSYSDTQVIDTTASAAENVQTFLQLFFDAFPKYSKQSFHITGESYAGHYIPAIAKSIQDHKHAIEQGREEGLLINLKSLAIGNGITDSLVQYEYYADMAQDTTYGPILSPGVIKKMRLGWPACAALIKTCYLFPTHHTCKPAAEFCEALTGSDFDKTKLNPYDLRKPPGDKSFDESEILMAKWINSPDIQRQLGVDRTFVGCNDKVGADFRKNGDIMMPIVAGVPSLLEDGIDILVYAGDADWTCNWIGNKAWALNLPWHGHDGFNNVTDVEWISSVTGRPAGVYRQFENFAFLKVYNSSHFVPADQPEHSLEFINKWIRGKSVISK